MQKPGHTAKEPFFAVCKSFSTRQRLGLRRVPRRQGTRQTHFHVTFAGGHFFCRGPRFAHGKRFAVCPICGTRQRPPLPMPECRVSFAVCGTRQKLYRVHIGLCRVLWHTANRRFPVVIDYFDYSVRLHLALQLRLLRLLADASSTTLTTR